MKLIVKGVMQLICLFSRKRAIVSDADLRACDLSFCLDRPTPRCITFRKLLLATNYRVIVTEKRLKVSNKKNEIMGHLENLHILPAEFDT